MRTMFLTMWLATASITIGAQQPGAAKWVFAAGAASGSVLWFSTLGYGARWLGPLFARPRAWQVLDVLIGLTMLLLSALLWRRML